jgi:chromosomal replication initiation ATPase DnaA
LQLPLNLPVRPALGRDDFYVSDANKDALARIEARDWPGGRLALVGPEGAGKTHLAMVWAAQTGARVIAAADLVDCDISDLGHGAVAVEDVDRLAETPEAERRAAEAALFHLHNLLGAEGGLLMVTGRTPPARWNLLTPDLASRLSAIGVAAVAAPDDALLLALIVKLFADRQVAVQPNLAGYLAHRIERSFCAVESAVEKIDRLALAEKHRITRDLAARALGWRSSGDGPE